ncbi:hypothetical protein [Dysgonomonas sp. 520]|uniref:hypothetical protein n=1 Tax=Dysgonomonas sp. 520 TaxID=2302931 RepID=UPI0013D73D1D|nr:hypothetical protein [Dysgonomonas sp. 520]NDW10351.1 hypothetical protein [Dysgonomonas sp. 520]
MKKTLLFLSLILACSFSYGQVGINTDSPHQSAVLDVQSTTNNQGMLLPRMTTAQKTAITSPATGLLVYDTTTKCISQNVGTEAAPSWVCLSAKDNQSKFFYMPSIAIDASAVATGQTLNLYNEYKTQFNTPMAASTSAPASIPYFPAATDLYYYITYYDNTVIKVNSLNANGVLNYDIIAAAPFASFMNVVMVVK